MTTTAPPVLQPEPRGAARAARVRGPRRRSVPHLILGILLVTACAGGAVQWSLTVGERRGALVLARPVTMGQALRAADLREVSVALDGQVDAVSAGEASSVIGQRLRVSLPAGVLLPRGALGAVPAPDEGTAVAALALQPGQVPPDLTAGSHVMVVLAAEPTGTNAATTAQPTSVWPGLVTAVADGTTEQARVVSVQFAEDDARQVAAVPLGRLAVVVVSGGDR